MNSMFWGVLIILVGVAVLVKSVFGIHLPIFKILFGLALIYCGIQVLLGNFCLFNKCKTGKKDPDHEAVFSHSTFKYQEKNKDGFKYTTVFGSSVLDLTTLSELPIRPLEITVLFGKTKVLVRKNTPLLIESQTVFGQTELPENNVNSFGPLRYKNAFAEEATETLKISSYTVFGALEIKEQ